MEKQTSSQLLSVFWRALLVALIIAVSFSGIADHDLWTPDEPREAAIALSMSHSGNLIIPELAGQPFVEKPPLFYVVASFFLLCFGKIIGNTAALRLLSACFGLGTLLFTYLLGKIYFDRQKALFATGILATMIGFVHVTHWILVDNALMFFITASVWALAKAYSDHAERGDKLLFYLIPAGIFVAFAFLTKGMIGPIIIGLAWLGIFIPWTRRGRNATSFKSLYVATAYHALGCIIAIFISTTWIVAFAVQGGPELFREWWWTNHFGRFTGTAGQLGHISPWYYYFSILPVYLLPWIVPFIAAMIFFIKKTIRGEPMPIGAPALIFWAIGALLLLSLSATKRDIYLTAFLPACALLCVYGMDLSSPTVAGFPLRQGYGGQVAKARDWATKVGEILYRLWTSLLLILLVAFAVAPLAGGKIYGLSITGAFSWRQILSLAVIVISLLALLRIPTPFIHRFLVITAMCYSTLLIIICPVIDGYKSYGPAFRSAAAAISSRPELNVAGWNLDETTKAGFYYYSGLIFPAIADEKMLGDILQGRNLRFNGALILEKNAAPPPNDLPETEYPVIFESHMGKRRLLQVRAAPDWQKKCRMKNAQASPMAPPRRAE